jgi:hypothetical protein
MTVAIANGSPRDFRSCAVSKRSSNMFNKKDARDYGPHKLELALKKISRKGAKKMSNLSPVPRPASLSVPKS